MFKVWRADDGVLCRTLEGHGHWVNSLALSTDYVLRTGPFHPVTDQHGFIDDSMYKVLISVFLPNIVEDIIR